MAYLVDFAVFEAPPETMQTDLYEVTRKFRCWGDEHKISRPECSAFLEEFFTKTGINRMFTPLNVVPPNPPEGLSLSWEAAMEEAQLVMFSTTQELLDKTGLKGTDIDILVTSCSSFHPVPSIATMLVNKFKMPDGVLSYHLGCMACSAGAIGINLVRDLLKANPNSNALFVCHENITSGFYRGAKPEALMANVLFGWGGSAMLLSNKPAMARRAKYQLLHSVRVNMGADDKGYASMGRALDEDGTVCFNFNADVPSSAQKAIKKVVQKIAPKILTWQQYGEAVHNIAVRYWWGREAAPPYLPCFSDCIDKFLLHPGTHAMLKGFMKGMKLPVEKMLPSAAALRDFGNMSSSSTYYVLAYLESIEGISRGQTIMQVSVGTGVKAGVNVWRAIRDVKEPHAVWAHLDGVPVKEADLVLPLSSSSTGEGGDTMAEATAGFGQSFALGRQLQARKEEEGEVAAEKVVDGDAGRQ